MCNAMRELMKEDFDKMKEEYEKKELEMIKNLMDNTKWSAEQVIAAMKIPDDARGEYMKKL